MCLVWSQLADIHTPPIVTSDFAYVRLIGDRTIQEKDFGRIQIGTELLKEEILANALSVPKVVAPISITAIAATTSIYLVFIWKFSGSCVYLH